MAHVDEDLSAYLAKELEAEHLQSIEKHLAECQHCSEKLRELQSLDALLDQVAELTPHPDFVKKVMQSVDVPQKVFSLRDKKTIAILAFAAGIMFIVFILSLRSPRPGPIAGRSTKPITPRVQRQSEAPVDSEMIAHLDELQNMDVIRQMDDLNELDAAMVVGQTEIEK